MRSGRLNQIVTIQRYDEVTDEFGQEVKQWVDVAKVWAGIEPKKSSEPFKEDQLNSQIDVLVVMRYRDDVDMKCQFLHVDRGGAERIYEVVGQLPATKLHGYHEISFNCRLLHDEATTV